MLDMIIHGSGVLHRLLPSISDGKLRYVQMLITVIMTGSNVLPAGLPHSCASPLNVSWHICTFGLAISLFKLNLRFPETVSQKADHPARLLHRINTVTSLQGEA